VAVDTALKRYSMLNIGEPMAMLPIPDGSFNGAERQTLLNLYSGIAATEVTGTTIVFDGVSFTFDPVVIDHVPAEWITWGNRQQWWV
jgi:hypothetical protein